MTKRVAQIIDFKVVNVVVMKDDFQSSPPHWVISEEAGIGDTYEPETGTFIKEQEQESAPLVPEQISDRQFFQQLAISGIITEQEAIAVVSNGTLPSAFEQFIEMLPSEQQFNARIILSGATEFMRNHPLTEQFRQGLGYTSEQLDQIWIAASQL